MNQVIRVIPRLDIKGPNLVKGIHLEGLRVLGNPEEFAKYYYQGGADELLYQDVVASLYGRNSLNDLISKTAKTIFIPLTVGGGLRSLADMKMVLRAGADKVTINTAALNDPGLISTAANALGASTISISIEAQKQPNGKYLAFTDNGREYTGLDAIEWAKTVAKLGAGEIILTSIDQEGTGEGYDLELTQQVAAAVSIPVVAVGGAGKLDDLDQVVKVGGAQAVGLASMLHYQAIKQMSKPAIQSDGHEGNIEFLKKGGHFSKVNPTTIAEIKAHLVAQDVICRYPI